MRKFRPCLCYLELAALAVCGCNGAAAGRSDPRPPGDEDHLESIRVEGKALEVGFSRGRLRASESTQSFRISRFPTTVAQFRRCVAAGACETPAENECQRQSSTPLAGANHADGPDHAPVTCVGLEQAQVHCHWLGGDLPSLNQWLLAARGATVQRYAWGNTPPSCAQHPLANPAVESASPELEIDPYALARKVSLGCSSEGEDQAQLFVVGAHPSGAAPSGVEDVLSTSGELLRAVPTALFAACEQPFAGCIAFGLEPGAIDSVEGLLPRATKPAPPESTIAEGSFANTQHPYSYRCVWSAQ